MREEKKENNPVASDTHLTADADETRALVLVPLHWQDQL